MSVLAELATAIPEAPARRHRAVLRANPRAVAGARRLVLAAVRFWRVPVDADTAALLVSELVTNAVTHGRDHRGRDTSGPAATIGLTITSGPGYLRVEVHDTSAELPVAGDGALSDAEHGRGLLLVGLLAETWGCCPTDTGKAVYFTLAA